MKLVNSFLVVAALNEDEMELEIENAANIEDPEPEVAIAAIMTNLVE